MNLITIRDKIATVAERWENAYNGGYGWDCRNNGRAVYRQLRALPAEATADDVAAIIGSSSWTELECGECGRKVDILLQLGEEPGYESATASVCLECLKKAVAMIEGLP